jgi:RNA recognition motif-containing protein
MTRVLRRVQGATYQSQNAANPSESDPTNTTLFIGNLASSVTDEDLRRTFGQYGQIVYTKVPTGKNCGFVQFVHRSEAEQAMNTLQVGPCCSAASAVHVPVLLH